MTDSGTATRKTSPQQFPDKNRENHYCVNEGCQSLKDARKFEAQV